MAQNLQGFENLEGVEKRKAVQATYTAEIGVTETSENDGPRIRHYRECVSQFDYPVSWCAIFVMYVYDQCEVDYGGANEWVPTWSRDELVIYERGKISEKPRTGDVFTLYYKSLRREGHVGFIDKWGNLPLTPSKGGNDGGDFVITVEGNTNIAGSRNGEGVHRKRRAKLSIHKVMDYIDA